MNILNWIRKHPTISQKLDKFISFMESYTDFNYHDVLYDPNHPTIEAYYQFYQQHKDHIYYNVMWGQIYCETCDTNLPLNDGK